MLQRRTASTLLLIVVALGTVACGAESGSGGSTTTTAPAGYLVSGYAHSGPTCPVVITPPDPTCDDRPVSGAVLIVRNAAGATVGEIRTGEDGTFSVTLSPGSYTVVPQPVEGLMGTAPELSVIVVDGPEADLDFAYDTGIR
jgi:hypothetical protein